ncbi:lytic murein transglycosylase [Bradyrhizobium sp. LHD-71]|uniref:lytic murein transglycosylase n=1 Tax=Bradyrhizobium sp. LHD-71 TaxID=3072141 RepID=UPI00280CA28B|nr:lytic murein transglycosylase [Bradyrhizobium sp. LHD-71]MDQ8730407.1 lytic murein transglycosylase [Bradyrhizobium sp. LHD-71]
MRSSISAAVAIFLFVGPAVAAQNFQTCVANLRDQAVKAGVSPSLASRALNISRPDENVLRLSQAQPEGKIPIWDYLSFVVDDQRVADGRAMMRKYDTELRAIERRFGVDRHVIAAIWGVETDYGRQAGDSFLPHALATLTCEGGRRAPFWRGELLAALSLVERGDIELDKLKGSWAGAFGHTQFIPSTYRRRAIDFDGDGKRDLVGSVADALASTANYLHRAGWRKGRWMVEAKVPADYRGPSGRKRKGTLDAWARRGVLRADGTKLSGGTKAALLLPAGPRGPGFLVFRNFDAIYAYNHHESYALAISYLANRLAGEPALRTPWPTDDRGLSRAERMQLQKLLRDRGYDVGEADGRIGPATREAIASAEKKLGMQPTGRAGEKILRALGGNP